MEARKTEIATENCVTSDLERMGEEWKNTMEKKSRSTPS